VAGSRAPRSNPLLFAGKIGLIVLLAVVVVYLVLLSELRSSLQWHLNRLYAAGVPRTWAEVAPPPIPDKDNAAIRYQRAFHELRVAPGDLATLDSFLDDKPPGSRVTLFEQTRRILIHNQAALSLVKQGAAAPECRFPLHWEQSPVVVVFPQFGPLRTCAKLLAVDAIVAAHEGDSDQALKSCLAQFRLAQHSVSDPCFFSFKLSGVGARRVPFTRALERAHIDAKTCARLYVELQRLDFQTPFIRATATEGSMILGHFDAAERNEPALRDEIEPLPDDFRLGHAFLGLYLSPLGKPLRLKEEIACAAMIERMVELARQPYREAAPAYAALDDMTDSIPRYHLITSATFGFHSKLPIHRDRIVTFRNAMQVALALKAYHAQRGGYPDSLRALRAYPGGASAAPEMRQRRIQGWKLPEDPFSGKDFGYRRKGAGFVLYSWGEDLRDNGGKPDRDVVWEFER